MTNWHVKMPRDKGIVLKDILQSGEADHDKSFCITGRYSAQFGSDDYTEKRYFNMSMGQLAFEKVMPVPEATKKGFAEIEQGDCVDLTQISSKTRRGRSMKEKSNCLTAGNCQFYQYVGPDPIGILPDLSKGQANRIYSVRGKSVCLNALGGGGGAKTGLYKIDLPDGDYIIRKLTPVECERLQTLPDNWTAGISNNQRYKAIGNGWTVDVIAWIFSQLPK